MTFEPKLAPPVVAVLVTDGSQARFAEVLDGLCEQDYENLQVVVVNRGQDSVRDQVISKIPEAAVSEVSAKMH